MGTLRRVLVPFLIMALPIAAMIAYIGYYFQEKGRFPPAPADASVVSFGHEQWPIFRGDAALTGQAVGRLPDALVVAWRFDTDGPIKATPVVAQGRVFVSSTDGHLYAIDLLTGQPQWRFEADDALEAAPLYADGMLYVGSGRGTFYALQAATGHKQWTFSTYGKIFGSANTLLDEEGRRRVIFGSYDNTMYGLDAADGSEVWRHEAQSYIHGGPALADGVAVFGSCDGLLYVVPADAPDRTDTIDIEAYMAASPAIRDGVVYAGNYEGLFIAADLTRREKLWTFRREGVPFVAGPAVSDEHVIVAGRNKDVYALDRADGKPVWTFTAQGRIDSSPVICGDRIIFGDDSGRLYIIDAADGRQVFSYTLGKPVSAGVAIADDTVLVGCDDGAVVAFRVR